jgi:HEAT repeat protein
VAERKNETVIALSAVKTLLAVAALSLLPAAAAEAQPEAPPEASTRVSERVLRTGVSDPLARAAVTTARRIIQSSLEHEDQAVRWAALRAARTLTGPWIAEFVLPLCKSPNLTERVMALETVANTNPEKGRKLFVTALNNGDRSVRLRGLLGLTSLGDASTIPRIIKVMEEDPDPDLRAVAAGELGDLGDMTAIPHLYKATESRFRPVREQALMSLQKLGDQGIAAHLVTNLETDQDPGVEGILKLLAMIPDAKLVSSIAPFLEHESFRIRILAAAAITSIRERTRTTIP